MREKEIFNSMIALIGAGLTFIFGKWDMPLMVLICFMCIDYITGLVSAAVKGTLNSKVGYKGIAKKASILAILIVAVLLDRLLNNGTWVFRTLVCYFYISNEGISILENCGKSGIPLPSKLLSKLEQLKNKEM